MFCFFFFKQKTAYEMRISDWSSDVCSSDLLDFAGTPSGTREQDDLRLLQLGHLAPRVERRVIEVADGRADSPFAANQRADIRLHIDPLMPRRHGAGLPRLQLDDRSEEHTSELQSLMRISYAVFCLKKKTQLQPH